MPLVDYSDSEGELLPPARSLKKRKLDSPPPSSDASRPSVSALPPLPSSFHDLYSSTPRLSTRDDPALHGGRKRLVPHVEGNWAAHVYLEWHPDATETEKLQNLISAAHSPDPSTTLPSPPQPQPTIHPLLTNDLGVALPLHISLSRPLALQTDQKDAFLASITSALAHSGVTPFAVSATSLAWHPNDDSSRYFLVLRLARSVGDALNRLLEASNDVAARFGLHGLYAPAPARRQKGTIPAKPADLYSQPATAKPAPPQHQDRTDAFHISVAWSLSPMTDLSTPAVQPTPLAPQMPAIRFSEVKVRIGRDVSVVPLGGRRDEGRGILG
ncbi:U6 snRNA phosphodiesterase Usb1 [Cryomyces antarcticus]